MEEYLPVFLLYMGVTMTITLIVHFVVEGGLFTSKSSEFGEDEFSSGFWVFGSLLLPLAIPAVLIMAIYDWLQSGQKAHENNDSGVFAGGLSWEEWEKKKEETEKRKKEARDEVLKNPSVTFEIFKKGRTTTKDYNNLITILENSRNSDKDNSDKDNSDEIVEIVREAYLAISEKKWTDKNKRKYEERLMKELEELNNG